MRTVPVTVVTGFLGAGKTTLLNRWLGGRGDGDVIVTEVGAVGIDGERSRRLRERWSRSRAGACAAPRTRSSSKRSRRSPRAPARIFVETSGAASPAGVVRAIARDEALRLEGIVTVVDGTRLSQIPDLDLAPEQIAYADVLVVTRGQETPEPGPVTEIQRPGQERPEPGSRDDAPVAVRVHEEARVKETHEERGVLGSCRLVGSSAVAWAMRADLARRTCGARIRA